jgi:hypothetical protein
MLTSLRQGIVDVDSEARWTMAKKKKDKKGKKGKKKK